MVFFAAVVAHFAVAVLALIGLRRRPVIAACVGLVVLALVAHQVGQGEAVVGGEEGDAAAQQRWLAAE